MNSIIFSGLPMPPSSNNCYVTSRRTFGRFPSAELRAYQKAMDDWCKQHASLVNEARRACLMTSYLRVDRYFVFTYKQLISQDGKMKNLDATNRIKGVDDFLSEALSFDDRHFTSGVCEKVLGETESVILVLTPCEMRTEEMVLGGDTPRAIRVAWNSEEVWNE